MGAAGGQTRRGSGGGTALQGRSAPAGLVDARVAHNGRTYATVITPKHLSTFHQCPLQYHLRYRRKLRGAIPPNAPPLAEGNALHAVMRRWFRRDPDRRAASDPAIVEDWLDQELAHEPYDAETGGDPAARDQALHRLSGHAGWCLDRIPGDARVHASERDFQSGPLVLRRDGDGGPVRFQARLDLVVQHPHGGVEHIDFKTGGPRATHWIQRGIERLVVAQALPVIAGQPPTRTTTLYAGHRQVESVCHTPETFRSVCADLRDLARQAIEPPPDRRGPDPTPAGHCAWCPFRDSACPAHCR